VVTVERAGVSRELRIREDGAGRVEGGMSEAGSRDRDFPVVLIREGQALSGRFYTRAAVEDVARQASGARAFANHSTPSEDRERSVRSVNDIVGVYRDARVEESDGRAEARATLRLFAHAEWLAAMVREGGELGVPVVGISIDGRARIRIGRPAGMERPVPVVEGVTALMSADVVTRPSAGGGFLTVQEAEMVDLERVDESGEGAGGGEATSGAGSPVAVATREETLPSPTPSAAVAPAAPRDDVAGAVREAHAAAEAAERMLAEIREAQLRLDCRGVLAERLGGAQLPEPIRARLARDYAPDPARWTSLDGYTSVIEAAIAAEIEALPTLRDVFAQQAPSTIVTGFGAVRVEANGAERQRVLAQLAMDRLFGVAESDEDADWRRGRELGVVSGVPRWGGIREAYVQLTGDALVSGAVHPEGSIVREANEVTTGVLNQALLNSMTKRLVRDYRGQDQTWKKFCEVVPVQNFKSQDRVRLHDFASLSTVAEGAAYSNLAWDDSRETYAPAKRGNLVVVTREAILNDDLRAITRIPQKLARAAHITINEFVYGLFTTNPVMNDGSKVFDDGVQATHGNRGTTALSDAALRAAVVAMMKQTDSAGKRLNLKPRYLLVPADLYFTALTIVNSPLASGTANNDANVLKGAVEPIPVAQFTDVTDYFLICDPMDIESIEIGFVGGREEPELLLQDAPLLGQVFTNDQISFKVRWEFGGGWLDYRGAFWGNVAG
jgi:hypothetical protein